MQTQILRRSCDNPKCDTKTDLLVGQMTPMMESDLSNWIILSKEHVLVSGQQPQVMTKQGCCSSCALEIVRNGLLDIPKKVPAAN